MKKVAKNVDIGVAIVYNSPCLKRSASEKAFRREQKKN